jgi:hypothetical protein
VASSKKQTFLPCLEKKDEGALISLVLKKKKKKKVKIRDDASSANKLVVVGGDHDSHKSI